MAIQEAEDFTLSRTIETAVQAPVVEETTSISPLEAFRLGRMVSPRVTLSYLGKNGKSCALGAIGIGMGLFKPSDGSVKAYTMIHREVIPRMAGKYDKMECRHRANTYEPDTIPVPALVEHYSDHHPRSFGTHERLVSLLEKHYGE